MNGYPPQHYYYYPAEYQPLLFSQLIGFLVNAVIVIGLASTAITMIRKVLAGEEVEPPFRSPFWEK
ncbi:hypothetical protein M1O12_00375 [Dehalococcoidia bacterium]|nr:hypothetical protein [Dehalococcoidia bacterium]